MSTLRLYLAGAFTLVSLLCIVISYNAGYNRGWKQGADDLFNATIDTVQAICNKQLSSDTSVTELVLINPDTTVYYLSRKTVLSK